MARKKNSLIENIIAIEKLLLAEKDGLTIEEIALYLNFSPIYLTKLLKIAQSRGNIVEVNKKFYHKNNYYAEEDEEKE